MIVGCYSLDLYCDNEEAHFVEPKRLQTTGYYDTPYFNSIGRSREGCLRLSKKAGWSVNFKTRTALCPQCKGKRLGGSDANS